MAVSYTHLDVYKRQILLPAFNIDYKEKFTDEASVVEAFGMKVHLVQGEDENIKITQPLDLVLAENIIAGREVSGN